MFEPGETVGDVEIVARLKAGGMAALYLGRRVGAGGFSKEVAVKVIHTHLADDRSFVEMFVDEARLSARIDHPNVVRVEALREHRGSYCLLMEFVHGCALSQLMGVLKKRDLRFSPELAVAIAIRVADGLHAAHELLNPDGTPAGVVHRDVSPANVLVGYRGEVKLIDFGIAKATQRLHQTDAAGLKGKIAYMAPEQAFGRHVDRRCDVYALGIVLWEMLTMSRLFKADNDLRLLDMVREPKVVPPSAIASDTPAALDRVVLEALAADRERRPMSTRELRYRLLDALPAAAAIDPLQISAVVCEVMSEKILEDRDIFSLSSFNALPQPSERESVTVSRLLRSASQVRELPIDEAGQSAEQLVDGLQHVRTEARLAPPTLLPQHGEEPPRRFLPLLLGAGAALGILAGVLVGVSFLLFGGGEGEASQTVTLPDPSPPPTVAAHPAPEVAVAQPAPELAPSLPSVDPALPTEPEPPSIEADRPAERGSRPRRRGSRTTRPTPPEPEPLAPADPPRPRQPPPNRGPAGITTQEI